jgi:hypothetical protein
MTMQLEKVVPFGRSYAEYVKIFNLSPIDLNKEILSVADGPASFNAEATKLGGKIVSIDPIYHFTAAEIFAQFNAVVDDIIHQIIITPDDWVWSYHKSPEDLKNSRITTIHKFLDDYDLGKKEGRYQIGELPRLNFPDDRYDLTISSHFLFLYSDFFDYQFHLQSIKEMLRVSQEVRIFPLLTLMLERSPYLDNLIGEMRNLGHLVSLETVEYELQKGANQMLVIKKSR